MPKLFTTLLTLTIVLFAALALNLNPLIAQETDADDIPAATLAPDSPFYFIQNWREAIESFITSFRSREDQANLELEFARRRVAEMRRLANLEGQEERFDALQERWQVHIDRMQELAEQISENREDVKERFLEQMDRHRAVMERVRAQVPEEAQDAIDRAIENYETNRARLLDNFEDTRREDLEERLKERLENMVERFELRRERFRQLEESNQ